MSASVGRFLDVARSQLGTIERPTNRTKYGEWFGLDGNAWCDMFVSWCAEQAGAADVVGRSAYTPAHAAWFKARGQFDNNPRPGDLVFFQWADSARICHVGIVESVRADGRLITLEGNSQSGDAGDQSNGGGVYRRSRARTYVKGFGHPAFESQVANVAEHKGPLPLAVDGQWGEATTRALQRYLGVNPDGDLGPVSVAALQRYLGVAPDGRLGPITRAALQRRLGGIAVDGEWGPATARALQTKLNTGRL